MYFLQDRLSTRLITDSSGNLVGREDNLPFGEDAGTGSGQSEKHRFTSYERDSETGSDYAINRQYSNVTGRFNRSDPFDGSYDFGNPQSLNRYAYVGGDPVNATDPLGLFLELVDCQVLIGPEGRPVKFFDTIVTVCTFRIVQAGLRTDKEGGGASVARVSQAYRRPGKEQCAKALAELGSVVKEFNQKLVTALMYGQNRGHYDKMSQLKNGITNELKKVKSSCFDKDGGPRFPDLTGAEEAQSVLEDAQNIADGAMKIPDVGTQGIDFTSMKIGAALGAIGGALSATGRAIGTAGKVAWQWVFGH